jgi:hypothetical protein
VIRRYILYLLRWQLSTPILSICVALFISKLGNLWAVIIANLIGGLIFFWVDRLIFRVRRSIELWSQTHGKCDNCKKWDLLSRLIVAPPSYDKTNSTPVFLCPECSAMKLEELKKSGVISPDVTSINVERLRKKWNDQYKGTRTHDVHKI